MLQDSSTNRTSIYLDFLIIFSSCCWWCFAADHFSLWNERTHRFIGCYDAESYRWASCESCCTCWGIYLHFWRISRQVYQPSSVCKEIDRSYDLRIALQIGLSLNARYFLINICLQGWRGKKGPRDFVGKKVQFNMISITENSFYNFFV